MKNKFVIAAIVFQLVALLWMASSRELIIQTGLPVKLQTAPIDPRDLFRGDFVRLNFEINELPERYLATHLQGRDLKKGTKLYALLEQDKQGFVQVTRLTDQLPENTDASADNNTGNNTGEKRGLFITGRLVRKFKNRPGFPTTLKLKYGIEQYFVEQGKGLAMEKKRGARTGLQVPMIMHLGLSDSGSAVLKSHDWGSVGMQLTVERRVDSDRNNQSQALGSGRFKLVLKNVSQKPVALPFRPGGCSFSVQSTLTSPVTVSHKPAGCTEQTPEMLALQAGQSWESTFDFNEPQWQVMIDGQLTSIGTLKWQQRFRLVYDEVDPRAVVGTALASRAFHGRGNID